jgi:hypothetical protein
MTTTYIDNPTDLREYLNKELNSVINSDEIDNNTKTIVRWLYILSMIMIGNKS